MMKNMTRSLAELLGEDYMAGVERTARLIGEMEGTGAVAGDIREPVSFFSERRQEMLDRMLDQVGRQVVAPLAESEPGAPTMSFRRASQLNAAPIGGVGPYRIGEDGRLRLAAKSEHYHLSLGHRFEGYRLVEQARGWGIPNATHNNTRGHVTRLLERELVRTANGLSPGDATLDLVLQDRKPKVLNRVINLETGSLAVEAGVKMMLARFLTLDRLQPHPKYAGRVPVFLVMGDHDGTMEANYHGTTVLTQMMRGLWPTFLQEMERAGMLRVVAVRINDAEDFRMKLQEFNLFPYKTAGFLHEIILMNYGGIRLEPLHLQEAYRMCRESDTPTLVDEIQSCMWYPGMYLFRRYRLDPDFVILGKGFPGGEYPASKIITTAEMDNLTQFGALVTNGQEELASLSYLVTMAFAEENADALEKLGEDWEELLADLQHRHAERIARVEGLGLLSALHFHTMEQAAGFSGRMNGMGIDVSAQTYKAKCPPAVLMKLPLISSEALLRFMVARMEEALA